MTTGLALIVIAAFYLVAILADWRIRDDSRMARVIARVAAVFAIVTQSVYMLAEARIALARGVAPLSSWHHWCIVAAWGVAIIYLVLHWRRPSVSVGVFILPVVLALLLVAGRLPRDHAFPVEHAGRIWGTVHGVALLLGTIVVTIGFAAGIMYLIQSVRLKRKRLPGRGIRLPSLEWLQNVNERSLLVSSMLLAGGLLAGIVLNAIHHVRDHDPLPWTDPVVVSSGLLFFWLLASCIFNWLYRPARVGRKVAYLTVASFVFLAIALAMTLFGPSSHASSSPQDTWRSTARATLRVGTAPTLGALQTWPAGEVGR